MASYDSNRLYNEIADRLECYPHPTQVTKPCILAPPPSEMILGTTEEMDPNLWSNLQHHIGLERIFAKLPFQVFFQLRLVCKDFNARASDEKFLEVNAKPLSKKPFFCLVHPYGIWQIFLEYDRVSNEWHLLRVSTPNGINDDLPPKWSGGGYLVFTEGKCLNHWIFTIFDLRTRMQHKLPSLCRDRKSYDREWTLEGLVVNQLDNTFRLVIAEMGSTERRTIQTSVYDSATKAWDQKVQFFPIELTDTEVFSSPPHGNICHNGNLYVSMYAVPCIMSYDLATGTWNSFEFPVWGPSAIELGCWDGHLYAISYRWDQRTGTMELYVHQFFEGTNKRWDEVCSIPLDLSEKLFKTDDPIPTRNEYNIILQTCVEASFCDEYVLISVFLEDYFVVDSGWDEYKIWFQDTLVPRRFALLNLEIEKWEHLDLSISRNCQRMEVGIEHCGFAYRDRKRVGKMIKDKLKKRKNMRR